MCDMKKNLTVSLGYILLLAIQCVQLWHHLGIYYAFEEFLFWDQVVFSSHAHLLPHPQGTAGLFHNICKPCANPHHTSHNSVSAWFHHCRLVSQPIRVRKILSTLLNFYETKLHAVSDYKDWSYKDRRWNFGEMNAEHVKIKELMVWWQKI